MLPLSILPTSLETSFAAQWPPALLARFEALRDSPLSVETFSFYTSVSAVFSSRIEGETIELDSYIRHKRFGGQFLPDYTRKTDDLYDAYRLAQTHPLTPENLHQAHELLTRSLLAPPARGRYRQGLLYVTTPDGRIEYVAAAPQLVPTEIARLWQDVAQLLHEPLSFAQSFYYAALLHLMLVKIHPYEDGNGRTARLLKKWFLAQKLGPNAWYLESEKQYYEHHDAYYQNLRRLGLEYAHLEYAHLNYDQALPFLLMLPKALQHPILA
ncbi:MAG: Fic family protein [Janthinobacterium lividum]